MDKLLSLQEIAERKLPGLPTTKAAIRAVAKRENWYFEEKTGIGGTRRVYEVPMQYLGEASSGAQMYSAAEIAAMRLEGLPTTKASVIDRATREQWLFEERKGLGGTRRVYEIPARYLPGAAPGGEGVAEPKRNGTVIGTVAAGSSKVNPVLLDLAIRALTEWEQERHFKVADDRRSAVIAILYDYLQEDGEDAMDVVLRALG